MEGKTSITIWKIENYRYSWHKPGECINSPLFYIRRSMVDSWRLILYPRGASTATGYTSIYLQRCQGYRSLSIQYDLSFLGPDGEPILNKTGQHAFNKGRRIGFPKFVETEDVFGQYEPRFLPEGTLTVQCCIRSTRKELNEPMFNFVNSSILLIKSKLLWETGEFNYFTPSHAEQGIFGRIETRNYTLTSMLNSDSLKIRIELANNVAMYRFKIGILDNSRIPSRFLIDTFIFHPENPMVEAFLIRRSKLLRNEDIYLPGGCLSLHAEVDRTYDFCTGVIECYTWDPICAPYILDKRRDPGARLLTTCSRCCANNYDSLKKNFEKLYKEGTFSDFSIEAGNETLQVHKAILCARSTVFKTMLTKNAAEIEGNRVAITQFETRIIRSMVRFMYTDKPDNLDWKTAIKLYSAADHYKITMLKRVCADYLKLNLIDANVEDIQRMAETHPDEDLKKLALEFLQKQQ